MGINQTHQSFQGLRCPACGYDLRGLSQTVCPECGNGFDPDELTRLQIKHGLLQKIRTVIAYTAAILSCLITCKLFWEYHRLPYWWMREQHGWCGTERAMIRHLFFDILPIAIGFEFLLLLTCLKRRVPMRIARTSLAIACLGWIVSYFTMFVMF